MVSLPGATESRQSKFTLWIDVEDLFEYRRTNSRPSGIQRVEYELCRSLASLTETWDSVRFVRHDAIHGSFHAIPFQAVEDLYASLTAPDDAAMNHSPVELSDSSRRTPAPWRLWIKRTAKRTVFRLPGDLRAPIIAFLFHQRESFAALAELLRAGIKSGLRRRQQSRRRLDVADRGALQPDILSAESASFETDARPGDVLVSLGSPWFHPVYADVARMAQQKHGLRFALLIYDIIPVRRPEWFEKGLTALFGACIRSVLPVADVLLTISQSTANDLVRFANEAGITLRTPPFVIPMGTGFTDPPKRSVAAMSLKTERVLPPPGSYALIVSTIEARKNHVLLFRVWRRLLDDMPAAAIPTLVFAGRVGWLVADLMEQLANANYLDGKIVVVRDPTDDELVTLYRGCQFTLFPSFYEGWGLPVTESLGFGRPCIVSNTSSLPEAGGKLARYFDPASETDAYNIIRETISDPADLKAWQGRILRDFAPVAWDHSALVISQLLKVH